MNSPPYTFLNTQLDLIQDYPLSDGLGVLSNLREYLKEQSKKPLIDSLYTAIIHKYPTKESTLGLNSAAIDNIMWAYDKQARLLKDSNKYDEAFDLYKNAEKINPKHTGCLFNHALLLQIYAKSQNDRENLVKESINQYKKCLVIDNDDLKALINLSNVLLDYSHLKQDTDLIEQAFEYIQKALKLSPNETYNIACYYSIKNNSKLCKDNLLHAEQHSTLPHNPFNHLSEDKDLDKVRNEQWFIELLERLKTKEEANKVT